MIAAGYHALNYVCALKNEVLCISSYLSVIRDKRVNASVNIREMWHIVTQEAEHSLKSVVCMWPPRVHVYLDSLPW